MNSTIMVSKKSLQRLAIGLALAAICSPSQSQLIVSELFDPQTGFQQNRYIEIANITDCSIDLSGWNVRAISNNSVCHTWNLSGTIAPGQAMTCGATNATVPIDFASSSWNWSSGNCNGNWNGQARDGAELSNGTTVVDYVKAGTGSSPPYFENSSLRRKATVCQPSTSYISSQWTKVTGSTGTPQSHAASLPYCGGTPGLWTAAKSTNWFDCANWDNYTVPDVSVDVTIDQSAADMCLIDGGQFAQCKSLSLMSSSATNNHLQVIGTSTLLVVEDLLISKTGGSSILSLYLNETSSIAAGSLTITGSASGAQDARFLHTDFTGSAEIYGNVQLQPGGFIDMSQLPFYGWMRVHGDFIHTANSDDFEFEGSLISFNGPNAQEVECSASPCQFGHVLVNKSGNSVTLNTDIEVHSTISFNEGELDLNEQSLHLLNDEPAAVDFVEGGVISESTSNASKFVWEIGASLGSYTIPFMRNGEQFPFVYEVTAGSTGELTVSTYGTGPENLPWPTSPDMVSNLNSTIGLIPDNRAATVDRFWQIDVTGSPTADLTFNYRTSELPNSPYNVPEVLVAQRYNTATNKWQPPLPNQTAAAHFVTVPDVTEFSPWAISHFGAALPNTWLSFEAILLRNGTVNLEWVTANEMNCSHFEVERSKNGADFGKIASENCSGFGSSPTVYQYKDVQPLVGTSYYRIKQVDFDGQTSYSPVRTIQNKDKKLELGVLKWDSRQNGYKVNLLPSIDYRKIQVIDVTGRLYYQAEYPSSDDLTTIFLPVEQLPKGIFMISLSNSHTVEVTRGIIIN